MRTFD